MPNYTLRSLAEVPGLGSLMDVCRHFDVEITAHGSFVRRLYQALQKPEHSVLDLYELVPLLSDIDLKHSGTEQQTPSILGAILSSVPSSECFRWDVRSEGSLLEYKNDEERLPIIPANKLQLATRSGEGIKDCWDGKRDLSDHRYRLMRNGFYEERSALRRANRDCELLHALFYLSILLEAEGHLGVTAQPGWQACLEIIEDSRSSGLIIALQESSYLRARIRYRLKAMRSVARSPDSWNEVVGGSKLKELLSYLDERGAFGIHSVKREIAPPDSLVMTSSCRLGGDVFRIPAPTGSSTDTARVRTGSAAIAAWRELRHHDGLDKCITDPLPELSDDEEIVAASPPITFNVGNAPSARWQEHLYFQAPVPRPSNLLPGSYGAYEKSLGVLLALIAPVGCVGSAGKRRAACVLSLSGRCHIRDYGDSALLQVGVDCGRLLLAFPDIVRSAYPQRREEFQVQLFISHAL